ncbi:MAG: hypothetical protein EKK29_05870 [Hyphomicrobiales bacterium]|nr:MAG: hypothetical protein EKK29_05870 [Hyphomicrobiales bacterium]
MLRFLEGRAINDGPERKPWLRVGEGGGKWYIDVGDPKWRVVEISAVGWEIRERHDLPLVRSRSMQSLPMPQRGGYVDDMRRFVNVRDEDSFKAVVAWQLAALRPSGPYPVLLIQGEQGSGKSVLSRLLRSIVDPNLAPIRTAPKDEEDLLIAAKNGHLVALDNVSRIDPMMADALCRVATGGGFSTRVKYTNDEEHVVWACNPILANGIPSLADRPDLASRALIVHLTAIPDEARQPEDEYLDDWSRTAPFVFGALCGVLSAALARLPTVKLARASRMADFEKLIVAASPELGWELDEFSAAYSAIRRDLDEAAFEADPVAMAIDGLIAEEYPRGWSGTATRLLDLLMQRVPDGMKRSRAWPQTAQGLGNRIERATPLLRRRGITVERRHSGERMITIAPVDS